MVVTARQALARLWDAADLDRSALRNVDLTGAEPALPSSFAIGTAAQASIAASGLAAAELHRARGGGGQHVRVAANRRHSRSKAGAHAGVLGPALNASRQSFCRLDRRLEVGP